VQEPDNDNGNGDDNDNDNFDCGFTGGVHCSLPEPTVTQNLRWIGSQNQIVEKALLSWRVKSLKVVE
jgi:hypothetical protein